jgi:hypothetical protein
LLHVLGRIIELGVPEFLLIIRKKLEIEEENRRKEKRKKEGRKKNDKVGTKEYFKACC